MKTDIFTPTKHISPDNTVRWLLPNGKLHRKFKPALIYSNGRKEWWNNGFIHRIEGPAVKHLTKTSFNYEWWVSGKLHRTNAPAVISNKLEEWWVNGELHRHNGPAIRHFNKVRGSNYYQWLNFGKVHRVDGPAVCNIIDIPDMTNDELETFVTTGYVKRYEWWYKNNQYSKEEYIQKVQEYKQEIRQHIIDANIKPAVASMISNYMTY
jgi:hypothetical protein